MDYSRHRILLAEPEPALRARIVSEVGRDCEVVAVDSGEGALARLAQDPAGLDLLVLAVRFSAGKLTGAETLDAARQRWPQVPVVMFGGARDEPQVQRCLALGAADVIIAGSVQAATLPSRLQAAVTLALLHRETDAMFAAGGRGMQAPPPPEVPAPAAARPIIRPFRDTQRECFLEAFRLCGNNLSKAADKREVPYSTYRRALEDYGAHKARHRPRRT